MTKHRKKIDDLLKTGEQKNIDQAIRLLEEGFSRSEAIIERFGIPSLNAVGWVEWFGSAEELFWTELDYSHFVKAWLVGKYLLQDRFVDAEVFSSHGFFPSDNGILKGLLRLKNLRRLDFRGSFLRELSPEICSLRNLETLILSGNHLTELPPQIGQLRNLKKLWLNHNRLLTLPESLCQLHSLEELRLNFNGGLKKLPDSIGLLHSLSVLNLQQTSLESLPNGLLELPKLQQLFLDKSLKENARGECTSLSYDFWDGPLGHEAALADMKKRVKQGRVSEISLALGNYPRDYEVVKEALQLFPNIYVHHHWRREAYY